MLAGLSCQGSNQRLLLRLDSILSNREAYYNSKEMYISILKNYAKKKQSKEELLKIYEDLYQEYYVYQFDSARAYINKAILLSQQIKGTDHVIQSLLYKVQLFGIGGFYSEASNLLNAIQVKKISPKLYFLYYITRFTLYSYRSDYCNDDYYSPRYRALAAYSLKMAMPYLTRNMPEYDFYHGEYYIYVT